MHGPLEGGWFLGNNTHLSDPASFRVRAPREISAEPEQFSTYVNILKTSYRDGTRNWPGEGQGYRDTGLRSIRVYLSEQVLGASMFQAPVRLQWWIIGPRWFKMIQRHTLYLNVWHWSLVLRARCMSFWSSNCQHKLRGTRFTCEMDCISFRDFFTRFILLKGFVPGLFKLARTLPNF